MTHRVHHLDCGPMNPYGGRIFGAERAPLHRHHMVCHCLLIECDQGLVLVDSGFGTDDLAYPRQRLGPGTAGAFFQLRLDPAITALHQLRALGYRREDVRHIVLTHLDLDHAGGLSDFPRAQVHVLRGELKAALARTGRRERLRYRPVQWAHGPLWRAHDATEGEAVLGFRAVRAVVEPDVLLLAAAGHTRGHAMVAVRQGDRWLLHGGDAWFHHDEVDPHNPRCPVGYRAMQRLLTLDRPAWVENRRRLVALARSDAPVTLFCAHDPDELQRLQSPS